MRFADNTYTDTYISTIGVDFKIRTINIDNKTVKVQIWDTAGQDRFRTIVSSYYRGAHCIMFVFDLTDRNSFENIPKSWMSDVQRYCITDVPRMLVGNKSDLTDARVIKYEEGVNMAKLLGMTYIETSAKNGIKVEEAYKELVHKVIEQMQNRSYQRTPQPNNNTIKPGDVIDSNKSKCC